MAGNNMNPRFTSNNPRFRNCAPPAGHSSLLGEYNPRQTGPAQDGFPFPVQQSYMPPQQFVPTVPPVRPSRLAQAGNSMSMNDINTIQYGGSQPTRGAYMPQNREGPSRGRGANRGGAKRGSRPDNRDRDGYDDNDRHGYRGRGGYANRGGCGNRGRGGDNNYGGCGNRGSDDYHNRGGCGNRGSDDYDNNGGRGNRSSDDYHNRGGRGNRGRGGYDNRSGRGNRDRDDHNNRGGRGNRGDCNNRGCHVNRGVRKAYSTQDISQTNFSDRVENTLPRPCNFEQEFRGPMRGGRGGKPSGQRFRGRLKTSGNRGSYSDLHDSDAESDKHNFVSGSSEDVGNLPDFNDSRGRGRHRGRWRGRGERGRGGRGQSNRNQGDRTQPDHSDEETITTEGIKTEHVENVDTDGPRNETGGKRKKGRNRRNRKTSDQSKSVENIDDDEIDDDTEQNEKETPTNAEALKGSNSNLDDIRLLNKRILYTRRRRYRIKIAELKKGGATSNDLKERYKQVSKINRELARRRKVKESKGKDLMSDDIVTGSDEILDDDDNDDDDDGDSDDDEMNASEDILEGNDDDDDGDSDDDEMNASEDILDKGGIDSLIFRLDNIITPGMEENILRPEEIPTFDRQPAKIESTKEADTRKPDVDISNEMFNFVVKIFQGKGDPDEIKRESGILPVTMDSGNWFKYSKKFNTIERNGKVTAVFAFFKDISYCLDYIKKAGCTKPDCGRFHVCKDMLCGNCFYGDSNCKFSHNLLDERNIKIADSLGLSKVFSSEEICSILRVRYPHVCQAWNDNGTCNDGESCPELHLCAEFVLNKCDKGPSCPRCHDRISPHNKPIVTAFKMEAWKEQLFKKMLYLKRTPKQQTEPIKETSEEDFDENVYLCHLDIVGDCERRNCGLQHSSNKLPYLWQVNLFGNWKTLEKQKDIEKSYCNCGMESFNLTMEDLILELCFEPEFEATISTPLDGMLDSTGLRRITTASYKDEEDGKESYKTQWRWYWQDDYRQWQLFEPDTLQHTLEAKYLYKQEEYLYARENYKFPYSIDFTAMTQINMTTDKMRKLRRRPLYVSRQDVQSRIFLQALAPAPSIDIDLPATWVPLDIAHPFELVKLSETCPEYINLRRDFYLTLKSSEQVIEHIYRVQNHLLWAAFCGHEKAMKLNAQRSGGDGSVEKRSLFHGTDSMDAVRGISINNFDFRLAGKNATMFGNGAYFAIDAKYSHSYTKGSNRFMFQAQVLVGEYTVGDRSYKRPPNKPGKDHELYDSCVDNVQNPRIFIVAEKNQYYPEYLIQYHDVRERVHVTSTHMPSRNSTNVPTVYPSHMPTVYPGSSRTSQVPPRQGTSSTVTSTSSVTPSMISQSSPPAPASRPEPMTSPSTSGAPGPARTTRPQPAKKDASCSIQ